jgi:hypothetical protein
MDRNHSSTKTYWLLFQEITYLRDVACVSYRVRAGGHNKKDACIVTQAPHSLRLKTIMLIISVPKRYLAGEAWLQERPTQ